jgi:hypothetical protein
MSTNDQYRSEQQYTSEQKIKILQGQVLSKEKRDNIK